MLILGEAHLRAVMTECQLHYNSARPQQGIAQRVPDARRDAPPPAMTNLDTAAIRRKPVLKRPDQRICARSSTPVRTAGRLPNRIFERDRLTDGFRRGSVRSP